MASSSLPEKNLETDITTICPICFESFKTPRILPCLHTFCHNCLSSYILSTCKSKENPVGFPCPLCRRFVPAPSFSDEIEKWTELIPVNEIAKVLSENVNKFCDGCLRAEEEIVASDWCKFCNELLCASCVKYHKRNAICKNHVLISIETFDNVSNENKSLESAEIFCQDHNNYVEFLCVDHEELCCIRCVSTKHRKCDQVNDITEAAENLQKSEKLEFLSKEIFEYDVALVKDKFEGEETIRCIDDTSDQIRKESTELRDKIVNHTDALLEDHLSELAQSVKQNKDRVVKFVDDVSDRHILMTQYLQTLKDTAQAPPPILVQYYFKIMREFKHVTKSSMSRLRLNLHSDNSKDLTRILEVKKFSEIQTELHLVPLCGIDFANARMELIGELNGSEGDVTGGCFLENGNIVLAHRASNRLLQYNKLELKREMNLKWTPRDVVCQSPLLLLISKHNITESVACVQRFDLDKFEFTKDKFLQKNRVYSLAISSGFVYAACLDFIVKFDSEGNIVKRYKVEENTMSVTVNTSNEIISSSCKTDNVIVINNSGEKLHSYFHAKLKYPCGLEVNLSRNIFVAGGDSNNIHILTPKAELLKIFEVESPRCIKFKEHTNMCFVGSFDKTTKVYEFKDLQK